jgi:hypothetical protein
MVKENNQTVCYLLLMSIAQYNSQQELIITQRLQLIIHNDKIKNENHTLCPFIKGLPDHDAQIITIHNIIPQNKIVILKLEENLIITLRLNL